MFFDIYFKELGKVIYSPLYQSILIIYYLSGRDFDFPHFLIEDFLSALDLERGLWIPVKTVD